MHIRKSLLFNSTLAVFLSLAPFAEALQANLKRLKVPAGFTVKIYAEVPKARQMALAQSGIVFVGTRGNHVYAVVDGNKDNLADQVVSILSDLHVGNGVAINNGFLYVAEQHQISRYPMVDFDLTQPFKLKREVIYDQLPDHPHHGWRYITFGPDNKLYSTVGAPCNICEPKGNEASIIRMEADGSKAEIFAKGIRNSVGMDFLPGTSTLYFTDNGVDMMGDDTPPGELNAATRSGQHFGFPFYAGGTDRQKDWQAKTAPSDITFPAAKFQAHSANLGFKFYTGDQFPTEFKGNAIIAQHGSWNRSEPVGYQLQRVTFDDKQQVATNEPFISGWLDNGEVWGRPTDVLQLADGSLLVSDDYNGVIYRISYEKQ